MSVPKTKPTEVSVESHIAAVANEEQRNDARGIGISKSRRMLLSSSFPSTEETDERFDVRLVRSHLNGLQIHPTEKAPAFFGEPPHCLGVLSARGST